MKITVYYGEPRFARQMQVSQVSGTLNELKTLSITEMVEWMKTHYGIDIPVQSFDLEDIDVTPNDKAALQRPDSTLLKSVFANDDSVTLQLWNNDNTFTKLVEDLAKERARALLAETERDNLRAQLSSYAALSSKKKAAAGSGRSGTPVDTAPPDTQKMTMVDVMKKFTQMEADMAQLRVERDSDHAMIKELREQIRDLEDAVLNP